MKEKFLITLATGKTGYETALQLLEEGYPVKIMVRSRNPKALELEKSGAQIVIGEFNNYEQIKNALSDVSSVYYCYPIKKDMAEDVAIFIKAAKEMKTESVVFMGQWLAEFENQQSLQTKSIQQSYKLLEQSGLNVVYLIPGYFAENNIAFCLSLQFNLVFWLRLLEMGRIPFLPMKTWLLVLRHYSKILNHTTGNDLDQQDQSHFQ